MTGSDLVRNAGLSLVTGGNTQVANQQEVQRQTTVANGNNLPDQTQAPAAEISNEELVEAVSNLSDYVQNISRQLNFTIDSDTGSTVVKVLDSDTSEVIRQIPSDEVLAVSRFISESIDDPIKGLLVQSEA